MIRVINEVCLHDVTQCVAVLFLSCLQAA